MGARVAVSIRPRRQLIASPGAAAVGALLLAGVGVRIYAILSYPPAVLTAHAHDAANYVEAARLGLGRGAQEPSGYPLFLRAAHFISHQLVITIAGQHAFGIAAGALLFLAVRRLGAPLWAACVPAAILWLNGDELFLEHALLSEPLFTAALAATLYAAVRALHGGVGWPLAVGVLVATLPMIRTVSEPLPLLVVIWLAVALRRTGQPWTRPAALALGAAIVAFGAYGAVRSEGVGRVTFFPGGTGWNLYSRAAEFADCRDFTPPRGTRVLCDRTPSGKRPGPEYYLWLGGPGRAAFGAPAMHDHLLEEFALAAIVHQPLDYFGLVGTDLVRYFDFGFGHLRPDDFSGPSSIAFPAGTPLLDPQTVQEVRAYYGHVPAPTGSPALELHRYQSVFRLSGEMLLALLIVSVAGAFASTGYVRWSLLLMLAVGIESARCARNDTCGVALCGSVGRADRHKRRARRLVVASSTFVTAKID